MTIEEAWLFWMKTRSTTEPPTETDFDVIKKSSHWAAFEAGWHAAHCSNDGWDRAYILGFEAGKEVEREACAKVCEAMADKQFRQAAVRIRTKDKT